MTDKEFQQWVDDTTNPNNRKVPEPFTQEEIDGRDPDYFFNRNPSGMDDSEVQEWLDAVQGQDNRDVD